MVEVKDKKTNASTSLPTPKINEPTNDDPIVIPGFNDKKPAKVQERVTIGESESKRLDQWLEQTDKRFEGFIKLNKSDLVGLLIRSHTELLSREELEKIKIENYDEGEFLKWAVHKRDEAKKKGEEFNLSVLFNAYRTVLNKKALSTGRTAKDKPNASPELDNSSDDVSKVDSGMSNFQSEKQQSSMRDLP